MAETNLAENQDMSPMEKDDKSTRQQFAERFDERKFSTAEIQRFKEDHVSIEELAAERNKLKTAAEARIKELSQVTGIFSKSNILSTKEQMELQKELDDTESPELTQKILDRLHDLPRLKEEAAQKEKDEAVELDPQDQKLLDLQEQFDKICDDNIKYIGEKQIAGNKTWFERERRKTPTIGHLKDLIAKMEGKEAVHKDGLAPRRAEYAKLASLYKKYDLGAPEDNNSWIRKEGLSERQDFRKKIEALENHFTKLKDTGFYSQEVIKKHIGELLKAENPQILTNKLREVEDIAREESEGFTHMNENVQVAGMNIRKMSTESRRKFMEYYRTLDIKDRQKLINDSIQKEGLNFLENLANNEAALTKFNPKYAKKYAEHNVKALDQIYKDNPEALRLALQSFEELDFMQKIEALKNHEKLANSKKSKEEKDRELTLQAANSKIDAAAAKNILSERTRAKYREFFADPNNFKNPQTQKPNDIKEMKKAYEILISATPQEKYKNLAAYETRRKAYKKDLNRLREINPNLSDEEIKKWQDKYDHEGWTRREVIHRQDLNNELTKQKAEKNRRRELEEKAGMKGKEQDNKNKEKNPKLAETIKAVTELVTNDQGAEAMKLLLEFNDSEPDNPKILFWMQTVANYIKEFGSGKKREKTMEKELERELEKMAESDETIKREILEQQVKTLGLQGARQSEQRHNQTISAHARAEKESMGRMQEGSLEADLTADAYKQMGEGFVVNKEGKAEKVEEVSFKEKNIRMQEQDLFRQKRKTQKEQSKLDTKEGLVRAVKDKAGNIISTKVAETLQKEELQKLEEKMATKAREKVGSRITDKPTGKLFDLSTKIAARRKAQELIDEKRKAKLKAA